MLKWVLLLMVRVLIFALFGFGAIASTFTSFALKLFWIFVMLFIPSIVVHLVRRL